VGGGDSCGAQPWAHRTVYIGCSCQLKDISLLFHSRPPHWAPPPAPGERGPCFVYTAPAQFTVLLQLLAGEWSATVAAGIPSPYISCYSLPHVCQPAACMPAWSQPLDSFCCWLAPDLLFCPPCPSPAVPHLPCQQTRAKVIRPYVEHMITLAKDGSLHARRQVTGGVLGGVASGQSAGAGAWGRPRERGGVPKGQGKRGCQWAGLGELGSSQGR
jgi:hypothetical protein